MFIPSACLFTRYYPASFILRRHKLNIPAGAFWATALPTLPPRSDQVSTTPMEYIDSESPHLAYSGAMLEPRSGKEAAVGRHPPYLEVSQHVSACGVAITTNDRSVTFNSKLFPTGLTDTAHPSYGNPRSSHATRTEFPPPDPLFNFTIPPILPFPSFPAPAIRARHQLNRLRLRTVGFRLVTFHVYFVFRWNRGALTRGP